MSLCRSLDLRAQISVFLLLAAPTNSAWAQHQVHPPIGDPHWTVTAHADVITRCGDLDGDGVDELLLGDQSQVPGRVEVLSGATGTHLVTLFDNPATSLFGSAIVEIGDIDGGGKPEIAISSPNAGTGAGLIYIFKGETLLTTQALLFSGGISPFVTPQGMTHFGKQLTYIKTFSGYGKGLLAVGSPEFGKQGTIEFPRGLVEVFNVRTTGAAHICSMLGEWWLDPSVGPRGEELGASLADIGDIDGDGDDELAIGATSTYYTLTNYTGTVHVVRGSTIATGSTFNPGSGAPGVPTMQDLVGPTQSMPDKFGFAIARVGGPCSCVRDLVVSGINSQGASNTLQLYTGSTLDTQTTPLWSQITVDCEWVGFSLSGFGDWNNDGVQDVLVGAINPGGCSSSPGEVFLVSGSTGAVLAELDGQGPFIPARFGSALTSMTFPSSPASFAVSDPTNNTVSVWTK
jgi:hypothetical protein